MIFIGRDEEAGITLTLDEEGIDYLESGLAELRGIEPGEERVTVSLDSDPETGAPTGVGLFTLRRA